jgi:pyruvate dehydrogenase E1 component
MIGEPVEAAVDLRCLSAIERRVLWLAVRIVDYANRERTKGDALEVGGHQASSASMVTALYVAELQAEDRVSVKPHASPVLQAIEYLLGRLDRPYLTRLRDFGGLQSYPSRTKDPYPVDAASSTRPGSGDTSRSPSTTRWKIRSTGVSAREGSTSRWASPR